MARGLGNSSPVMDEKTTAKADRATAKTEHRHAGPYGASFDGTLADGKTPARGLTFERRWTRPDVHPYDEITWEYRTAGIANESGKSRLRAEGRRGPRLLEPARHQRRGQQVLPRPPRNPGARDLRPPADRSRRQHDHGLGRDPALLRDRRGPADLQGRADPPDRPPEDGVQLAGLVQRGHRAEAAVQRLLHQLGRGHDVLDHGPGQDRGDAVQVRLGRRQQPLHHPLLPREDGRRRHRLGPRLLHEGLRRLRRRREVGRQDPPRGQDGHPRCRPPGRRGVHRFEGARGAEGLGADRGRLRPQLHRRGLRLGLLPERQPLGPRDRCVHAGRRRRRGVADPRGRRPARGHGHLQGPRPLPQDGRGRAPVRRPGHPVRHDHQRVAHLGEHGPDPRVQPVLRVHVPQRHRVQPGQPQPDEVRRGRRRVRRRRLPLRGQGDHHRPGDPGRQRVVPDAQDRGELAQVPAARAGLREPRRAADVTRPRLRLRRGPQLRRRADRDHARRGVQAVEHRRPRPRRPVRRPTTRTASRSCGSSTSTATPPTRSPPTRPSRRT